MKPHPIRPLPVPEAAAFRCEAESLPPDAIRALDALEEADSEHGEEGGESIPPVPESLRARWEEAYGNPSEEQPAAAAPAGWVRRLVEAVSPARVAWAGAAAAACAALLLLAGGGDGDSSTDPETSGVVTRGGGGGYEHDIEPLPVIVVADAESTGALRNVLTAAFPGRRIEIVSEAPSQEPGEPVIVLNAVANTITRPGGEPVQVSSGQLTDPDAAVAAIEEADESSR